jgi:tetratricopeptide (TPR) repeat protein
MNRAYHNTTARYNGYFNAREIIKEQLNTLSGSIEEDYTKILPIYLYPDEVSSKSLYEPMDKAIDKTLEVIKRHSMPRRIEGKKKSDEWCRWIDDNWFVMSQAHFYKREFESTRKLLEFIEDEYKTKEVRFDCRLWQAKLYLEMGDFDKAQSHLTYLEEEELKAFTPDGKKIKIPKKKKKKSRSRSARKRNKGDDTPEMFPKRLRDDLQIISADLQIRRGNYEQAIERINLALELTRGRKFKTRLTFILAQLYQKIGNRDESSKHFAKVVKMNPPYEMAFYAKIYRALMFDAGTGKSKAIKDELLKMLKDEKNKEFQDQIYYALADIEFKEDDKPQGIAYLKESVSASVSNDKQKGLSYLRLADIHFADKLYPDAKTYYDSTAAFLPQDYPDYEAIALKGKSLTGLVNNLNIYNREDSLQRIAGMEEKERLKFITDMIQKLQEEEAAEKQRELEAMQAANTNNTTNRQNQGSGASWWAYNQTTRGVGFTDFKKKWLDRKLEDNWRRSNKSTTLSGGTGDEEGDSTLVAIDTGIPTVDEALANLPMTPGAIDTSTERMSMALYEAGVIYKDKLNDVKQGVDAFTTVVERFRKREASMHSSYQLYLVYLDTEKGKSDKYKQIIFDEFPGSEYDRILRNPNYKKEEERVIEAEKQAYEETYREYGRKNYSMVVDKCSKVIKDEPKNHLLCKYHYLKANALGQLSGDLDLKGIEEALVKTVEICPTSPDGIQAKATLDIMRNRASIENIKGGGSPYVYDAAGQHLFFIVFPNSKGSINNAMTKISNFNKASFSTKNLKTTKTFLNTENQVIVVKSFPTKDKAMDYYIAFKNSNKQVKTLKSGYDYFVITDKNYTSFYVEKKIEDYKKFFKENYEK